MMGTRQANLEDLDRVQGERDRAAAMSEGNESSSDDIKISWMSLVPANPEDSPRELATSAAGDFALQQVRLLLFIGYNIINADPEPLTVKTLGKLLNPKVDRALAAIGLDPKRNDIHQMRYFIQEFGYHERIMYEMIFCRIADTYARYLTQLLALIYHTKPDTLLAEKIDVPVDFVLQFPDRDWLIYGLAERIADQRRSLRELSKFVKRTMRFDIVGTTEQVDEVARIDEERNIIVHNGGMRKDKDRFDPTNIYGVPITLDFDKLKRDASFLAERVRDTDARAAAKFDLPRHRSADMAELGVMLKAMVGLAPSDHTSP